MIRLLRLPLALLLALGVSLPTAAPAAAGGAACSSSSAEPNTLHVNASFAGDASTYYVFYVEGPERRTVWEGNDPGFIKATITGLEPGLYAWKYDITWDEEDGTTTVGTKLLTSCTVFGGPVITPPLEKPTAIAVTPIALGTATISWNGGPGTYRVVAKRLNKRGKIQPATKRTCEVTLSESGSGSCELLELRPGRWRIRTTRSFEGATSVRVKVIRITAAEAM